MATGRTGARRASPRRPVQRPRPGSWRELAIVLVTLAGLVFAAHAPVLSARALSADDDDFVTNNRLVLHPSWDSTRRFFVEVLNPSTVAGYYLPVSMTSLMLDYASGGRVDHPVVFHRTSLALHIGVTLLLAILLFRLFGSAIPAGLVALVYGIHPLTVEPVAWISERKTLLATLFALTSVIAYVESARRASRGWRLTSLAAFALALLSKPSVTTLPLLLLLLDVWPLQRFRVATIVEKWPWFALAAASVLIATLSLKNTGSITGTGPTWLGVVLRMLFLPAFYLAKTIHPVRLSILYSPPDPFTLTNPPVLFGVVTLCALSVVLFAFRRRWPGLWIGWLFFLVALIPTFGILVWSRLIAWDRYVYFPAVGWVLAVGWMLERAWKESPGARRIAILVLVLSVAALEARGVRAALRPWKDSVTLWRHAVAMAPGEPWGHNGLGVALSRDITPGVPSPLADEARHEFEKSLELSPDFVAGLINLATMLIADGRAGESIPYLQRASALAPRSPVVAYQLGWAAHETGQLDSAATHYERALALQPAHIEARVELGIVRIQQGRAADGIEQLRQAAALAPAHPGAQLSLAMGLLKTGGHDAEAIEHLENAVRLKRDWQAPMNTLAWLRATHPDPALRNGAEAVALASRVVELTEGREPIALDTQAAAEAAAGQFDRARESAARALTLAEESHADSLAAQIRSRQAKYARGEIYTEPVRANY